VQHRSAWDNRIHALFNVSFAFSLASLQLLLATAGSLAALCLEEQGLSASTLEATAGDPNNTCSSWASLCMSDAGSGFWGLCGGEAPGSMQAPAASVVATQPPPVAATPPPPVQLFRPPSQRASAQGQLVPGSSLTGNLAAELPTLCQYRGQLLKVTTMCSRDPT
jgi:hypothetical protein